jgi:hypothetical protein
MVHEEKLVRTGVPPAGLRRWQTANAQLQPPQVTALHRSLQAWGRVGFSPGPITAARVWFGEDGALAFAHETAPKRLLQIGLASDLAAWLVLLDKSMATFVVVARARALWQVDELAAALTFLTPAFLPRQLVQQAPNNWERVAQALAEAVAGGPLAGGPREQR